jgi:8-oxo-dGTP pyrophosphatase MutT (NUDIX family)
MKSGKVRPLAICVFRHEGRILAAEGYDRMKKQTFYRPLGGKIEFGETGAQTVARELMEEINAEVAEVSYLGTLENLFTFEGKAGHEIVLIYDGRFTNERLYQQESIEGVEDDTEPLIARWLRLDWLEQDGAPPLYPDGLLHLLRQTP